MNRLMWTTKSLMFSRSFDALNFQVNMTFMVAKIDGIFHFLYS